MKDKNFWEKRSKSFPRYREGNTFQSKMMEMIKWHGVDFTSMNVIDIGCGTGAYTLRIAKEAKSVTALDISAGMLASVREGAEKLGLDNIEYVESAWASYTPRQKYDISLCSLTPGIDGDMTAAKVYNHTLKWGIHIGFAGAMRAYVLEGLYKLHNIDRRHQGRVHTHMRDWLEKSDIPFSLYRVEGDWETPQTREEMFNNCRDVVTAHLGEPKMDVIAEYIEQFRDENGIYISKTYYNAELIIWDGKYE